MKTFLVLSVALFLGASLKAADDAQADALFQQLVTTTMSDDYEGFVSHGTTELKGALTKTQVDAVSAQMAPRLKGGYEILPLGEINQRGYQIYLYCLRFKAGGDDILGMMSLKNGQVGGILFK